MDYLGKKVSALKPHKLRVKSEEKSSVYELSASFRTLLTLYHSAGIGADPSNGVAVCLPPSRLHAASANTSSTSSTSELPSV